MKRFIFIIFAIALAQFIILSFPHSAQACNTSADCPDSDSCFNGFCEPGFGTGPDTCFACANQGFCSTYTLICWEQSCGCSTNCNGCQGGGGGSGPTPTPTPTPVPPKWNPPVCSNGGFSGCSFGGNPSCTDYGGSYYSNWSQSLWNDCNTACHLSSPNNYCVLGAPTNLNAVCSADARSVKLSWNTVLYDYTYSVRVNDDAVNSPSWVDYGDLSANMYNSSCVGGVCTWDTANSSNMINTGSCWQTSGTCSSWTNDNVKIFPGVTYDWSVQPYAINESYPAHAPQTGGGSFTCNVVPSCNSTPVCTGTCTAASPNTCGTNNGTQSGCIYTTYSSGGTCIPVTAPPQPCTINGCSTGYACVNGSCLPPTLGPLNVYPNTATGAQAGGSYGVSGMRSDIANGQTGNNYYNALTVIQNVNNISSLTSLEGMAFAQNSTNTSLTSLMTNADGGTGFILIYANQNTTMGSQSFTAGSFYVYFNGKWSPSLTYNDWYVDNNGKDKNPDSNSKLEITIPSSVSQGGSNDPANGKAMFSVYLFKALGNHNWTTYGYLDNGGTETITQERACDQYGQSCTLGSLPLAISNNNNPLKTLYSYFNRLLAML